VLTVYPAVNWAPRGRAHEFRTLCWKFDLLPRNARNAKHWSSVCLYVRNGNVDVPCWVSSNVITRIISLGSTLSEPQLVQGEHPQNSYGIWNVCNEVVVLNRKPAISLKRSKIRPWLLLMTNRKLHTRFRLIPKSMTLDDNERLFRTLFQNTCDFGAHHENLNEDRPILSAAKM